MQRDMFGFFLIYFDGLSNLHSIEKTFLGINLVQLL